MIMKGRRRIGRFFALFILMVILLTIALAFAFRFYMKLFNDGTITHYEALLLGVLTLLAVIGVTIFVGWKFISYLKSLSKKSIRIFGKFRI